MILIFAISIVSVCVLLPDVQQTESAYAITATGKIDAKGGANLRTEPSVKSSSIMVLKNNRKVTINEEVFTSTKSTKAKNRWYLVSVAGKTGYVRSDLIDTVRYKAISKKTTYALNYRKGPNPAMARKGTFKKGKKLNVVLQARMYKSQSVWYKVKKGSKYYFVDSRYTANVSTASTSTTTVAASVSTSTPSTTTTATAAPATTVEEAVPILDDEGNDTGLTISGVTYPVKTGEGYSFSLRGVIQSPEIIGNVTAGVVDQNGEWVISASAEPDDVTFDITAIDSQIKFGTLNIGSYTYKILVTVDDVTYTAGSYPFTVVKVNGPGTLASTAINLAWPIGTASSKYTYGTGSATAAYKKALDYAFPNHSKWGKVAGSGASCDVFVSTVCRYCGYDTSVPQGVTSQWSYYASSSKWIKVNYSYKESDLRSGDIIIYKKTNGNWHVCMYVKINGKGCIAEASYTLKRYGFINTSLSKILKSSDKTKLCVYRAAH